MAMSEPIVVGVGASAGGLEAFTQLLQALPADNNLAIVLVQHLSPQHESSLQSLIGQKTSMEVVTAVEGQLVQANHVYVIPPNVQIGITDGRLYLRPRPTDRTQYTPIDAFLHSLAKSYQNRAVGVILSGTASDGAGGVRDIKAAGGITIAQQPSTAKYDGMPRAAIATGMVDLVLTPPEIAERLGTVQRHPYVTRAVASPEVAGIDDDQLAYILTLLRKMHGVDFQKYKMPTVRRRVLRRMALHRVTSMADYLRLLRQDRQELNSLYQDLFIHVTRFFRDPEAFEALANDVVPVILKNALQDAPVRIWVPGCATGEEAYSVAMTLLEHLPDPANAPRVQIFATDVSESAIETARAGVFASGIAAQVPADRLKRHFVKMEGGFKISKSLRDMCVFAKHDLTRDPPFSRLDLLVCRNVLIYLDTELQKRLMSLFHYALRPSGFLMLGPAETTGHQHLFTTFDKKLRIFRKVTLDLPFPLGFGTNVAVPAPDVLLPSVMRPESTRAVQDEASRIVIQRYSPPGVVVDRDFQIVQFRGQTGPFLESPSGEPSLDILKMAREGMLYALRSALHTAKRSHRPVRKENVQIRVNGDWHHVNVEVIPLTGSGSGHLLVLFNEVPRKPPEEPRRRTARAPGSRAAGAEMEARVTGLTQELAASREYMQSIIQALEAANEELQSANEEILSSNEELQSTNEELDTAKEELQSTNEELNTVNEELYSRNDELSRVNSDLLNLLACVESAIVIVGRDMRIRRFTPMAQRVLNVISTDVGRPFDQINPNIVCPELGTLIRDAVDHVASTEREVQDRSGRWYTLRIRPYKNVDNRIDGAVLALTDSDSAKRTQDRVDRTRGHVLAMVHAADHPIVIVNEFRRVREANAAFHATFGLGPDQVDGRRLDEIGEGQWDVAPIHEVLDQAFASSGPAESATVERTLANGERATFTVSARELDLDAGTRCMALHIEHAGDGSKIDSDIGR